MIVIIVVVVNVNVDVFGIVVVVVFYGKLKTRVPGGKKTLRGGERINSKLNPWKKNCIASVIQAQVILVGDKCLTTIPLLLPKMVPSTLVSTLHDFYSLRMQPTFG